MRRTLLVAAGLLALVAAAVFHVRTAYAPRLRSDRPGASLAAGLLASDAFPVALWVPYPHQNLGLLERATGHEPGLVAAVARLAGLPEPRWPAFGSMRVPPASELAFATDGARFALVAEVYPAVAAFAKLSGRLAGNPWLVGGELTRDGRPVEVAWRGSTWIVASPSLPELPPATAETGPLSLLTLAVRQTLDPLPAGHYHLTLENGDVVVRSETPVPTGLELEGRDLLTDGPFLLVAAGPRPALGEVAQAMAFFAQDEAVTLPGSGDVYELPGMAVVHQEGGERWSLPAEGLLELIGKKPRTASRDGWGFAALDEASARRVRELMPRFVPLLEPRPAGSLAWGLWVDLDGGVGEVARISRVVEKIPLLSERRKERWRDARTVLEAVARSYSRLSVTVTDEPRALRLRLEHRRPGLAAPSSAPSSAPPTPPPPSDGR